MIRQAQGGRRRIAIASVGVAAAAALATGAATGPAAAQERPSAVTLDVQTYNLDLGADLTPLFGATSIETLQSAAAHVYGDVTASRPVERMGAIAKIIAKQRPDVVGLQEVAQWQLAPYTTVAGLPVPGRYRTTYDFLKLLLRDLAWRGVPYDAVSTNVTFDSATAVPIAIPISTTTVARFVDRNVVLVNRATRPHARTSNARAADYTAKFSVSLLGRTVDVGRGWASVDIRQRGRTFRFIDTHLEAYGLPPLKDQIRNPQAAELAALAKASPYPTIVVGDLNARPTMCATWRRPPDPQDANTVAYGTLQAAGMTEVWPLVHPSAPCDPASWTSGQDSLTGPTSTLTHRIDDVFLSPGLSAQQASVVGDTAADRTHPDGLWPSDHASTVAKVRLDARLRGEPLP